MQKNIFETVVGAIVLFVCCASVMFVYNMGMLHKNSGNHYSLKARFNSADGVDVGTKVRIAGVEIGSVTSKALDFELYTAVLEMKIKSNAHIPADSTAEILTSGLIGSRYINIAIGESKDDCLNNGEEIVMTQSPLNFENLIMKYVFNSNK